MINASGMHLSPRSYLTAGVAVLGAGAVVLAPVQPLPERAAPFPHRVVSGLETTLLASSFDPITPWIDTITTAIDNIGALIGFAFSDPFPIGSAIVSNPGLALSNFTKLFTAPFSPGETLSFAAGTATENPFEIEILTPGNSHLSSTVLGGAETPNTAEINTLALQIIVPIATTPPCSDLGECTTEPPLPVFDIVPVAAALKAINNYASGVVLGLLGPALAPVGALINSVTATIDFIGQGDFIGALNELVNIPANLVNGFLNGATLNLTPIVNLFAPDVVDFVGLNLGGLIAGPVPMNGSLIDPNDAPTEFSGGTLFTSLAVTGTVGIRIDTPGLPTGPIGSLIGMGQYLGEQLLTPPETPAAETAAAVEVQAPAAVAPEAEPSEVAKASEAADPAPAAVSVTAARADATAATSAESAAESASEAAASSASQAEASTDEAAPTPTRTRATRTAPAAAGADTPAPRAAAASRR